jgi:hypothetical protein
MLTCLNITKDALPLTFQKVRLRSRPQQYGEVENEYHFLEISEWLCSSNVHNLPSKIKIVADAITAVPVEWMPKKTYLKHGATLQPIELNGYWVNSVSVEDVAFLELEWQDSSRFSGRF